MNSSTVIPLSACTFLKTSSTITGPPVCPAARAPPRASARGAGAAGPGAGAAPLRLRRRLGAESLDRQQGNHRKDEDEAADDDRPLSGRALGPRVDERQQEQE